MEKTLASSRLGFVRNVETHGGAGDVKQTAEAAPFTAIKTTSDGLRESAIRERAAKAASSLAS